MADRGSEAITMLVTPVWKDSRRLERFGAELAEELARAGEAIDWVIADDGSGGEEVERLGRLCERFKPRYPRVRVHAADAHRGKGAVVREAWSLDPRAAWLAFVDADGSVNAADTLRLIRHAWRVGRSTIAIRRNSESTRVEEDAWRRLRHRGFLVACHRILGVKSADTQCGAKVLEGGAFRRIADRLVEPGLAFDAELLAEMAAAGIGWDELPVSWVRKGGSKVMPVRDAAEMLSALFRIRRRLRERSGS